MNTENFYTNCCFSDVTEAELMNANSNIELSGLIRLKLACRERTKTKMK